MYFYCDNNFAEKKLPIFVLGSVLRQLYSQLRLHDGSPIARKLKKFRASCIGKPDCQPEMIAEITQMAGYFTQVYIVVDGVEECPRGIILGGSAEVIWAGWEEC